MKKLFTLSAIALAASTSMLFVAPPAQASERNGLSCPTNTDVDINNGVLKCSVTLEFVRGSICPPLGIYVGYTQIEGAGADKCKPQGKIINNQLSVDSAMDPVGPLPVLKGQTAIPGDIAAYLTIIGPSALAAPSNESFKRKVNPTGADSFTASKVVHIWPKDMPIQNTVGHNARNGVACPAGFETTVLNGRGLRCSDTVVKKAGCDGGFSVERKDGTDVCVGKDLLGNRVIGQYTIPLNAGYVGAMGNPARNGWTLIRDRNNNANLEDFWEKDGTVFKLPVAR